MTTTETPRVWIACLAAYNNGRLHGQWVDATDADELREAKDEILSTSPVPGAEEWAIHDYDGFGSLSSTLGEYVSFDTVARVGALIEEHGEAFIAYVYACEPDLSEVTSDGFHDAFRGKWDSEEEYAEGEVRELGWGGVQHTTYTPCDKNGHPQNYDRRGIVNPLEALESYLDYEKIARDLFIERYTSVRREGGIYVFEKDR
jgi:antirestriction protein